MKKKKILLTWTNCLAVMLSFILSLKKCSPSTYPHVTPAGISVVVLTPRGSSFPPPYNKGFETGCSGLIVPARRAIFRKMIYFFSNPTSWTTKNCPPRITNSTTKIQLTHTSAVDGFRCLKKIFRFFSPLLFFSLYLSCFFLYWHYCKKSEQLWLYKIMRAGIIPERKKKNRKN